MMRIVILVVIIGAILAVLNGPTLRAKWLNKWQNKQTRVKFMLGLGLAVLLLLMLSGRMHWLTGLAAGLLAAVASLLRFAGPLLLRLFPLLQQLYYRHQSAKTFHSGSDSGKQSEVQTSILAMTLDHDTGQLEGTVKTGAYAGVSLAELSLDQLLELYQYCAAHDSDSTQLLASYLDRRFEDWRSKTSQGDETATPSGGGDMSRQEALSILGLQEPASKEDVIAAHRKLMQKVHPDRGGSDYLAAKVNQAKDSLLN